MKTYTPGPWYREGGQIIRGDYGFAIEGDGCDLLISPENERLILAAPDLLEALKAYVEEDNGCYSTSAALAAIAKAEGK